MSQKRKAGDEEYDDYFVQREQEESRLAELRKRRREKLAQLAPPVPPPVPPPIPVPEAPPCHAPETPAEPLDDMFDVDNTYGPVVKSLRKHRSSRLGVGRKILVAPRAPLDCTTIGTTRMDTIASCWAKSSSSDIRSSPF